MSADPLLDQRLARAAAADVLTRVRALLEQTHQTRTLPDPVVRALVAANREYGVDA